MTSEDRVKSERAETVARAADRAGRLGRYAEGRTGWGRVVSIVICIDFKSICRYGKCTASTMYAGWSAGRKSRKQDMASEDGPGVGPITFG